MNIIFSGIVAAGFVASAVLLTRQGLPDGEDAAPAAPIQLAAATPGQEAFRLAGPGGRGACRLTRIAGRTQGNADVEASADCDRLLPGLSHVRVWREQADGSVALDDASGTPLAQFAEADGAGYESFRPKLPPLSLTREN